MNQGPYSVQFTLLVTLQVLPFAWSQVAPVITTGPEGVAVFEGMSASFLCSAMGRPRPNITWFRAAENSTLVAVNASVLRVSVSVDETDDRRLTSVLTLTAVSSADIGRYICLAENELSNASASAQLRLKEILQFLPLGSVSGVETEEVGHFYNGVSHVIHQPGGFPFGNKVHDQIYISTNGYFSFSEPFYEEVPEQFPGTTADVIALYLVAPFWDNIDLRRRGNIFYEVHSLDSSPSLLSQVSHFVSDGLFSGTWMLVAQWDQVHPWPDGESEVYRNYLASFGITSEAVNSFQGVLITDGTQSYAVFTYNCSLMEWTLNPQGATIGYNAANNYFENHPNTGSSLAHEIACLNTPHSKWYNVVYKLSVGAPGVTLPPPPTVEPPQVHYLKFLEFGSNVLEGCRNCTSSSIPLGESGIAFGSYFHTTVYVETNGVISFGRALGQNSPALFPTEKVSSFYGYTVAPYWSDIDTRLNGSVRYQTYSSVNSSDARVINTVADFINAENGSISNASWMLVATWEDVHPFPHGESAEQDRQDPYLGSVNTFQAVLISNYTKTYSVFTYNCHDMDWSGSAVIGFNAGGEIFHNHSLSGGVTSRLVGCVHMPESVWNNVVYDLTPVEADGPTPNPPSTIGSCAAAGHTDCCAGVVSTKECAGLPQDCFCDKTCVALGDCCRDHPTTCPAVAHNDTYLVFSDTYLIGRAGLDGSDWDVLPVAPSGFRNIQSLDVDYQHGYIYLFDAHLGGIFRASLDGSSVVRIVDTKEFGAVEDLAVDWVNNKVYWTESRYRRIEVIDPDTRNIVPLVYADAHSGLRGIVVDPSTRYMYWTDWGVPAKVEKASMDGRDRTVIHTGLSEPYALTIDYHSQIIYWIDTSTIEYSNVDGTNRRRLHTGLQQPRAITVEGSLVFWTSVGAAHGVIQASHKLDGGNIITVQETTTNRPFGLEVVGPGRQLEGISNACDDTSCEQSCLLSATNPRNYSCVCLDGYILDGDGQNCTYVGTEPPPEQGSCGAAGFDVCCSGNSGHHCLGYPPTCSCDADCHRRRDCCSDIRSTCHVPSSCSQAGHDTCCTVGNCNGEWIAGLCFCDVQCHSSGDCCDDINATCPFTTTRPSPTTVPPEVTTRPSPTTVPPEVTTRPSPTTVPPEVTTRPSPTTVPPEVTTRPSSTTVPPEVVANTLVITLSGYTAATFDSGVQQSFKETTAAIVNAFCAQEYQECSPVSLKSRRQAYSIMPNDVKLTDISEDGDGHITFYLYLRVDNGILRAEHILQAVQEGSDDYSRAGFPGLSTELLVPSVTIVTTEGSLISTSLDGGEISGIVIVVTFVILVISCSLISLTVWIVQCQRRHSKCFHVMTGPAFENPMSKLEESGEERYTTITGEDCRTAETPG